MGGAERGPQKLDTPPHNGQVDPEQKPLHVRNAWSFNYLYFRNTALPTAKLGKVS